METVEHTLNGNPDFGRSSNVTVLRNGDLATRIYLKIKLNSVRLDLQDNQSDERLSVAWVRRLGHCLLKQVDIEIGGSRIDRQFGTWLDIWYELTHDFNQQRGYRAMIGDVNELTRLHPVTRGAAEIIPEYELYIPLQFWFNRNTGLALPLIALQYHEVRILFEFEEVHKLIVYSGNANFDMRKFQMKDASILVDYIYLDSEERRRFAQVGHEYLIEQVQFTGEETLNDSSRGTRINQKYKLGFNHPTKELIWALKNGAYNGESTRNFDKKSRFLTYTNQDDQWETSALDYAAENIARGMISCDKPTNDEVQFVEVSIPAGRDIYVFHYKANGFDLTITFHLPVPLESSTLVLYIILNPLTDANDRGPDPYNLGRFIHKFDVALFTNSDVTELIGYDIDVTRHSLRLNDVSIPMEDWVDYRTTTIDNVNKYDVTVVQCSNYGVRLDGKGRWPNKILANNQC
ncbi:major capsid protein [Catovirus CTV1]|uniref:Major capsid protein n=1 Tax=Catovirus CTV1 TaxID=1977631 RepID=A0A1V0SCA2_9VIRU|nr:major capsid protein [Catovirus CTV1]